MPEEVKEENDMEFFRRNIRKLGYHFYLVFAIGILAGCGEREQRAASVSAGVSVAEEVAASEEEKDTLDTDSYALLTDDLIRWDQVKETETEDYYIVKERGENEDGETVEYPQIIPKEGAELYCGAEQINDLLKSTLAGWDYNILFADRHYVSIWNGTTAEMSEMYVINLQCPVVRPGTYYTLLLLVQDDNDYRNAPWPSNGITLSMDAILEEIEQGNCYTDENGYAIYREDPEAFIDSVRRQFAEIEEGGYEEAYWAREDSDNSKKAYKMYLREGLVGFYIHPIEVWEETESKRFYHFPEYPIDTSRDFRIEVPYDWKKDAPAYHMPCEVYGELCESETYGTFYYPQIRGLDETITASLNAAMKEDLRENLAYMDLDEWNERMRAYGWERYWDELPQLMNPGVTYQTGNYLCIWQDLDVGEYDRLRMAENWKRYHVYDLETGQSLKLGDVIRLDEDFVMWIKQEKKIEATDLIGYQEGMHSVCEPGEWLKEELDDYPAEVLLAVLGDAEFWLKDGSLFVRLPQYDEKNFGGMVYLYGGNDWPDFLQYYEVRIALDDLQGFLLAEPWGE